MIQRMTSLVKSSCCCAAVFFFRPVLPFRLVCAFRFPRCTLFIPCCQNLLTSKTVMPDKIPADGQCANEQTVDGKNGELLFADDDKHRLNADISHNRRDRHTDHIVDNLRSRHRQVCGIFNSRTSAPRIAGIDIKNEYFTAKLR